MKVDSSASAPRQTPRRLRQRPVPLIILRGHTTSVTALAFLSSSSSSSLSDDLSPCSPPLLASADELGVVRIWDLRYEECVLTVRSSTSSLSHQSPGSPAVDPVISVLYHPPSTSLYAQYKSGRLTATDLQHDTQQQQQQEGLPFSSTSLLKGTPKLAQSFCRMACVSSAPLLIAAPADGFVSSPSSSSSSSSPFSNCKNDDSSFVLFDPRMTSPGTKFTPASYSPLSRKQFGILLSLCSMPPVSLTTTEPHTATSNIGGGDAAMIAAGYEGGALAIWDVRNPGKFMTATSTSSAFSAAASSISSRSTNGSSHNSPLSKPSASSSTALLSVACHPRGHVLAAAGASPYVHAFGLFNGINNNVDNTKSDRAIHSRLRLHPLAYTRHAHTSTQSTSHDDDAADDGVGSPDEQQQPQQQDGIYENSQYGVSQVCWTPDGRALLVAGWDGGVRVCDGRRRTQRLLQPVTTLRWHDGSVTCVDCVQQEQQQEHDDARWLPPSMIATGGRDTTIAVWDGSFSSK